MISKRLRIEGHVQGVGYRNWMVQAARQLGVSGWVRNRHDGSVEAHVEGDPQVLEELLRACHRGPPAATVTQIRQDPVEPEGLEGFEARSTAPSGAALNTPAPVQTETPAAPSRWTAA